MAVLFDPFRELDRVAASMLDSRQGPRLMPIGLYRDGDHYVLNADLPGMTLDRWMWTSTASC